MSRKLRTSESTTPCGGCKFKIQLKYAVCGYHKTWPKFKDETTTPCKDYKPKENNAKP